ncbi:hypothetical protein [Pontibacter ruber]|uniref:GLPGLI family protein n=1 Tax=Pontibacter ruber TaxID=1343895 RepID=A0ABW5CTI4_9BACT|nr:hypothetical protein [Pontibacter ruber]
MHRSFTWQPQWLTLFVALLCYPILGQSQTRPTIDVQEWPTGEVVLTTGETMTGALSYHQNEEVVQVRQPDGAISTFSPVNVVYFTASDFEGGPNKLFRAYDWNLGKEYSDFKKPTFFEQLNEGKLTLIMREEYVQQDVSRTGLNPGYSGYYPYGYPAGSNWVMQVKEVYFVLLPNGDIRQLRNVRRDLQQLFGKKWDQVKSFIKMNKLDYDQPHHMIAIINFYNSLP